MERTENTANAQSSARLSSAKRSLPFTQYKNDAARHRRFCSAFKNAWISSSVLE
jgi:hypothetical protein